MRTFFQRDRTVYEKGEYADAEEEDTHPADRGIRREIPGNDPEEQCRYHDRYVDDEFLGGKNASAYAFEHILMEYGILGDADKRIDDAGNERDDK